MSILLECEAPASGESRPAGNPVLLDTILPEVLESLLAHPRNSRREMGVRESGRETDRASARPRGERSLRLVG